MSRKSLVLMMVAALTLSLALAVSMSFAGGDKGPAEITLNADGKKPALFPHAKHQEKNECATCHHGKADDGTQTAYVEGMEIKGCAECHNADFANEKLRTWKDVGHAQCKDCHTTMKDQGAPTKCNDCHIKQD